MNNPPNDPKLEGLLDKMETAIEEYRESFIPGGKNSGEAWDAARQAVHDYVDEVRAVCEACNGSGTITLTDGRGGPANP